MAPRVGAALATLFSRFERLTILKTPGFAGGWLLIFDSHLSGAYADLILHVLTQRCWCFACFACFSNEKPGSGDLEPMILGYLRFNPNYF